MCTVTADPLLLNVPFHTWLIVCPLSRVQRTVQPLSGELPAVTVTSPWKPPGHELTVRYDAWQAPGGGGLDDPVAEGLTDALADGLADALADGLADGLADEALAEGDGEGPTGGTSGQLLRFIEMLLLSASCGHRNWVYRVSLSMNIFSHGISTRISVGFGRVNERWSLPVISTQSFCVVGGRVAYSPLR